MRYSMLVYLTKMCRTLLEATDYLNCAAQDDPVRTELLQNGRVMLGQIETELTEHKDDLLSARPMEYMDKLRTLWENGGSELEEALEGFTQCLTKDVRYRVRAVFFAGLGSTWDSMESVYEYMRDDPRFDPVVVLIPIIRIHEQDGEIENEVIYEDYLTARNIPFYGFDKYNIDEDCPDLAFTSQPYEGSLTSDYWPTNLSQKTRLVYLPYFLSSVVTGMTMKSLRDAPVNRYAWKVVCGTEKEYHFYCRHLENGGVNCLLSGLPKLDHLSVLRERGTELPDDWECLEGRKVFLWNSWYILNISSLGWTEEILEWFAQHDDCALIWRPHPMTDTVTRLHHPEDYGRYREHVQRAKDMLNVVFDEEISYEAAFYYSDAMISDFSSMQPQYLLMDKPSLWIKNDIWQFTGEEFISSAWMDVAKNADEIMAFLDKIRCGDDPHSEMREQIISRDLTLADGHAGERLCEMLLNDMQKEDFMI